MSYICYQGTGVWLLSTHRTLGKEFITEGFMHGCGCGWVGEEENNEWRCRTNKF